MAPTIPVARRRQKVDPIVKGIVDKMYGDNDDNKED